MTQLLVANSRPIAPGAVINVRPIGVLKMDDEGNAWLEDQCIAYAQRTKHPEFKDRTVWDVFQEERASLMALRGTDPF